MFKSSSHENDILLSIHFDILNQLEIDILLISQFINTYFIDMLEKFKSFTVILRYLNYPQESWNDFAAKTRFFIVQISKIFRIVLPKAPF